jgi:hypothetical protein
MRSSIVLARGCGTGGNDPKAVGLEQHTQNVPKSLIVLDQENDMHRIGHAAILSHQGAIHREDRKNPLSGPRSDDLLVRERAGLSKRLPPVSRLPMARAVRTAA